MCPLPGYAPLITADSDTNAGGVGAYVSKNVSAIILGKNLLQSNCGRPLASNRWKNPPEKFLSSA